ncbi:MAG: hypothetical protein IJ167_03280 [Lachnospiraceae bacterium]|nr:hypothetical protein [Lachnospiraceae bacterium]
MHNATEYSIPVTIKEKAQIIPIKKNVRIDNNKIQSFIETLLRRKRIASLLYILFVVISILSIIYTVCFHGLEQKYGALILFLIFMVDIALIIAATYIDKKWSADRLHIKPIQKYEFTDNDSKVLCTTSRYDFEKNDTETELFPNKYVRFDLENEKVPFLEAYTYRTSPKYWITIHLTKEAKNKG